LIKTKSNGNTKFKLSNNSKDSEQRKRRKSRNVQRGISERSRPSEAEIQAEFFQTSIFPVQTHVEILAKPGTAERSRLHFGKIQ
jgi:hypothetical protein